MDKELQEWYQLHEFNIYSGSYQTKELAEYLGISERTIQRWLKEKTKPSAKQLIKIGTYLETKNGESRAL